jgi:hypothetical protein
MKVSSDVNFIGVAREGSTITSIGNKLITITVVNVQHYTNSHFTIKVIEIQVNKFL